MGRKSNTKEFIKKAKLLHGDKYDYSLVNYIGNKTKVDIICPKHGKFSQKPNSHLRVKNTPGCPKCGLEQRSITRTWTLEEFTKRANKIHKSSYDYSKGEYVDSMSKILIICPEHGKFWQKVNNHLNGQGCPKCNYNHGFSRSRWIKFCNQRKNSEPKLYIIRCFNEDENFIKIGITIRSIAQRFPSKGHLPYEYEVIKEIKGSPTFVYDRENYLHKKFSNLKYKPLKSFLGETECFTLDTLNYI